MSFGKYFLSALIAEQSLASFLRMGGLDHLFLPSESTAFEFIKGFVKEHGKVPAATTVLSHTGEELPKGPENTEYYLKLMNQRYVELVCRKAMKEASDFLLPGTKDPDKCLEAMARAVTELATRRQQRVMADFRAAYDVVVPEYAMQAMANKGAKFMTGWPTLDDMTGGFVRGDFLSLIGRIARGKSFHMLYGTHHSWNRGNRLFLETKDEAHLENTSRMFVTNEMDKLIMQQRLASMQAKVPVDGVRKAKLTSLRHKRLKDGLLEIKGYKTPFWFVDANLAATVEDLYMLARQLKPGAIAIDGAYLLQHPRERDRHRRAAENAELIKRELCPLCPVVASWQFARPKKGKKGEKSEEQGLDDIGYTDVVGQISTVVIGLLEDESVETIKTRRTKILKGRNGEVGEFLTRWDFLGMDFSEYHKEAVADLEVK